MTQYFLYLFFFSITISQFAIVNLSTNKDAGLQLKLLFDNNSINYEYSEIESLYDSTQAYFLFLGQSPNNIELSKSYSDSLSAKVNAGLKLYIEAGDFFFLDEKTSLHDLIDINAIADSRNRIELIKNQSLQFNYTGLNYYLDLIETDSSDIIFTDNHDLAITIGQNNQIVANIIESHKVNHINNHPFSYWAYVFEYLNLNPPDPYEVNNQLSSAYNLNDSLKYINSSNNLDFFTGYYYKNDTLHLSSSNPVEIKIFDSDSNIISNSASSVNHQYVFSNSGFYFFLINNNDTNYFDLMIDHKNSISSLYSPSHIAAKHLNSEIIIHFQKPDSIPSGSLIDYYIIERTETSNQSYSAIDSNFIFVNSLQLLYRDNNIDPLKSYQYRIKTVFKSPFLESHYSYTTPIAKNDSLEILSIPYTSNSNDESTAIEVNIQNFDNFYNYTESEKQAALLSHDHDKLYISIFRKNVLTASDQIIISFSENNSDNYLSNGSIEYKNSNITYYEKSGNYLDGLSTTNTENNPVWLTVSETMESIYTKITFMISLTNGPIQYNFLDSFALQIIDFSSSNFQFKSNYPESSQFDYPLSYKTVKLNPKDRYEFSNENEISTNTLYNNLDIFPLTDTDTFKIYLKENHIIRLTTNSSRDINKKLIRDEITELNDNSSSLDTIYYKVKNSGYYSLIFSSSDTVKDYSFSVYSDTIQTVQIDTFSSSLSNSLLIPYQTFNNQFNFLDSIEFQISSTDTNTIISNYKKNNSMIELKNLSTTNIFIKTRTHYKGSLKSVWSEWHQFNLAGLNNFRIIPFDTSQFIIDASNDEWNHYLELNSNTLLSQTNEKVFLYYQFNTDTQFIIIKQSSSENYHNDILIEILSNKINFYDLNGAFPNVNKVISGSAFNYSYQSGKLELEVEKRSDSLNIELYGDFSLAQNASYQSSVYLHEFIAKSNMAPYIIEKQIQFTEDSISTYAFTVVDPDSDPVQIEIISKPNWVTIDTTLFNISGIPNNADVGQNYLVFKLKDSRNIINSNSIELIVENRNDPPIISGFNHFNFNEDDSLKLALNDYISDPDHSFSELLVNINLLVPLSPDSFTYRIENDSIIFRSKNNFYKDSIFFNIVVSDSTDSSHQSFSLSISSINDPPIANIDTLNIHFLEDQNYLLMKDSILNMISDPDDSFHIMSIPFLSNITINEESNYWEFIPDSHFYGNQNQVLHVSDSQGLLDSIILKIEIESINDLPKTIFPNQVYLLENTDTVFALENYFSDIESTLSELSISFTIQDTVIDTADLNIFIKNDSLYISCQNEFHHSNLNIEYTVSDQIDSIISNFTLGIVEVNEKPEFSINRLSLTLYEDSAYLLNIDSITSLIQDSDDSLFTFQHISFNDININTTSSAFIYQPKLNYFGQDSGYLIVSDKLNAKDSLAVFIEVIAVNDAPQIIEPLHFQLFEDSVLVVSKDSIAGDSDNNTLNFQFNKSIPDEILMIVDSNQFIYFFTNQNFHSESEDITIIVTDSSGLSDSLVATIEIRDQNDKPIILDTLQINATEDQNFKLSKSAIFSTVLDYDNDLNFRFTDGSIISENETDSVIFSFQENFYGKDSIELEFFDSDYTSESLIIFDIRAINDPPVIELLDTVYINEDEHFSLKLDSIISDIDNNYSDLTVSINKSEVDTTKLRVEHINNVLRITPKLNQSDFTNKITIIVNDSDRLVQKDLNFTVLNRNDPPEFLYSFNININEDSNIVIQRDYLDSITFDPDNDSISYSVLANTNFFVENDESVFSISPIQNYYGIDSLVFIAKDPAGLVDTLIITATVNSINDSPFWTITDSIKMNENDSITFYLSDILSDSDHQLSELNFQFMKSPFIEIVKSATTLKIKPKDQLFGSYNIKLIAVDPDLAKDSTQFVLDIIEFNDPPVFSEMIPEIIISEDIDTSISIISIRNLITDPDDKELNYEIKYADLFDYNITDSIFALKPKLNLFGQDSFLLIASDKRNSKDSSYFSVNIHEFNDPPFSLFSSIELREEDSIQIDPKSYIFDPDNSFSEISTSVISYNQELVEVEKSNIINIRGKKDQSNIKTDIILKISDLEDAVFDTLEVHLLNINDKPVINFTINDSIDEDTEISIPLNEFTVYDPDHSYSELGFYTNNDSIQVLKDSNQLRIIPKRNISGIFKPTLFVTDSIETDSQKLFLNIFEVNDLPSIKSSLIDTIFNKTEVSLAINQLFTDPDDNFFTFSTSHNDYKIDVKQESDSIKLKLRALPFKNRFKLYFSDKSNIKDSIEIIYFIDPKQVYSNLAFDLKQNYPNPFNPVTKVPYFIPTEANVEINIYNVLGQLVFKKSFRNFAGNNDFVWDARNFASGIYFLNLKYLDKKKIIKIVLLK